jgi:hypothetical protein
MSSPMELTQRKLKYKIVQKLDNNAGTGFTIDLNPIAFPFSGVCKVSLQSISLTGFTATPTTLLVDLDISQPYSQSNLTGQTPSYNSNRTIYASQLAASATTFNDTDLKNTYVYASLSPQSRFAVSIKDVAGTAFAGNYVGVLILEIDTVEGL